MIDIHKSTSNHPVPGVAAPTNPVSTRTHIHTQRQRRTPSPAHDTNIHGTAHHDSRRTEPLCYLVMHLNTILQIHIMMTRTGFFDTIEPYEKKPQRFELLIIYAASVTRNLNLGLHWHDAVTRRTNQRKITTNTSAGWPSRNTIGLTDLRLYFKAFAGNYI